MKKFMRTPNQGGSSNPGVARARSIATNGSPGPALVNGNGSAYCQNGMNGGVQYHGKSNKVNGHANGVANGRPWTNGYSPKAEDKQSSLSRYWTTDRQQDLSVGYLAIRRLCLETGQIWDDPDFPPLQKSLSKHKKPPVQPIVWMRPHEMCTRPLFRGDTITSAETTSNNTIPGDVSSLAGRFNIDPGELGDHNLLAAVASLAFTPKLLDRVVPPDQDFQENYCGVFRFRFWHFGEWKEVLVDDKLPTCRGRLIYIHSSNTTEFWAPLLEKAYAKFYGCYESLQAGTLTRALQDLTGGIVQSFVLNHQDRYLTFQILNSAVPRSSLLIATIQPDKEKKQLRLRNGLITCQAYSVTGLARVRGGAQITGTTVPVSQQQCDTPLVRLRNPTGRGEWNSAWAPTSWEWHGLSQRDKDLLSIRITNDGEFWMSFEDFSKSFTSLELVHIGPDDWMVETALHSKRPWRAVLARRRWRTGYNAGGGPNYTETTAMNPQFHVQIPRASSTKCHVVVSVTQHYETRPQRKSQLLAIGFAVYEIPPSMPRLTMHYVCEQKPLDVTNHSVAREVVTFFTLPPGDYIVVPQTATPNVDGKFLLRILTDEQSNIWEVNEDNMVIRNISAEFLDDPQLIPVEVRASLIRLFGKKQTEEVDAAGLRRALSRVWRGCLTTRPSLDLCRSLLMLRDTNISGRIPTTDIPSIVHLLQFWKHVFGGGACAWRASSYGLRALVRAGGVCVSNKVLECLVLRFAHRDTLTHEAYIMAMVRLHLAHERFHTLDTKMKSNPLSLEEMILMTIYS